MNNVDMIIAEIDTNKNEVYVTDVYSTSENTPGVDSQQFTVMKGYSLNGNTMQVKFNRLLDTGFNKNKVLVDGSSYTFTFAFSNTATMTQHSSN